MKAVEVMAFPGQGTQDQIPELAEVIAGQSVAQETVAEADEIIEKMIGKKVVARALDGAADFSDAKEIQTAIFSVQLAIYKVAESKKLIPKLVVGHSLGEYAAMAAAKVVTLEDGLRLVVERARGMMAANEQTPGGGTMAAINGLKEETVRAIAEEEDVEVANFNSLQQFVLSGIKSHVRQAVDRVNGSPERGVKASLLEIPYAAHSRWMGGAAELLRDRVDDINFQKPKVAMLSNRVENLKLPQQFRQHLPEQLVKGVNWYPQMIEVVYKIGYRAMAETGPGKVLSRLTKRSFGEDVEVIPVDELVKEP